MSKPSKADLDELFKTLDLAVFKISDDPLTRVEDDNGVVSYMDKQGMPRMLMDSATEAELMAWADREGIGNIE